MIPPGRDCPGSLELEPSRVEARAPELRPERGNRDELVVREEVLDRVRTINATGVSILMVEQRARQCLAMADHAYVLEQGRNRLEGPGEALLQDPEVVRLYLGVQGRQSDKTPGGEAP